ncbi:MAG: hypothetical protein GYA57_19290 [Myxococcales bacterium]|nr:hypothetical protein [Myxococcales bacterium]
MMLALATLTGLLVAVVPSAVHHGLRQAELRQRARRQAEHLARRVHDLYVQNPVLWRYDTAKHLEAATAERPEGLLAARLFDGRGALVYADRTPAGPAVWGGAEVRAAGEVVGRVEVAVDGRPARRAALVFHLVFCVLGASLGLVLYLVPLRAVQASEADVRSQAEDRARIARELHDGAGQSLAAARLHLMAGSNDAAIRALDAAADELRRAVDELRPPGLEGTDLAGGLRELADAVAATGQVAVELELPGDLPRLPPAVEHAAYRIAQEAVANVLRHAAAARLRLALQFEAETLELQVADDGRGACGAPEGRGIAGMRERARELGGTLAVRSEGRRGTLVTARIPLEPGVP